MNPDKLFDYLDGRLSRGERAELEARLISDPQLQQELAIARQIHNGMQDSREIFSDEQIASSPNRGAVLGRRIAIAFVVLMFANVAFGIYAIAFMEKKRHAQATEAQMRSEVAQSLSRTAATALPAPTLGIEEITLNAPTVEQTATATKVISAAEQAGGSAAKGLADEQGILIFAEIPTARLSDFRESLKKLGASIPRPPPETSTTEKTILQIRILASSR